MNFELVQGDDLRVFLTIRDRSGALVDLSGATSIEWAAGVRYGDVPVLTKTLALAEIVVSGPGLIYFDITAADSGGLAVSAYKQETEIVTSGGLTYTVGQGVMNIKPQLIGA